MCPDNNHNYQPLNSQRVYCTHCGDSLEYHNTPLEKQLSGSAWALIEKALTRYMDAVRESGDFAERANIKLLLNSIYGKYSNAKGE